MASFKYSVANYTYRGSTIFILSRFHLPKFVYLKILSTHKKALPHVLYMVTINFLRLPVSKFGQEHNKHDKPDIKCVE